MKIKNKPVKKQPDGVYVDNHAKPGKSSQIFLFASIASCLLLFLAVYLLRIDRIFGLFVDDAWYVLLAQSLATGQGYQLINSPTPGILPVYPPGYPLLVSLVYRLWPDFPNNIVLLKSVSIVAMFVVGIASYQHFRRNHKWPHFLSLLCALTVTLIPALVFLATSSMMSECVFTAFQLLAVVTIEAATQAESKKVEFRHAALGGILAALAFLTRSIGLAVIVAGLMYLLKERRWRSALVFIAAVIICAAPWTIYSRLHAPTAEQRALQGGMIVNNYLTQFWQTRAGDDTRPNIEPDRLPERMGANAVSILGHSMARLFVPVAYRSPKISGEELLASEEERDGLSYLISFFVLLGFVWTARRRLGMAEITVALTVLITCAWPWPTFRFLVPIAPFLLAYLLESVSGIRQFAQTKLQAKGAAEPWDAMTVLLALLLVAFIYDHSVYRMKRSDLSRAEYLPWQAIFNENLDALHWMREKLPADAVVCSKNPALVYLYTGRKSVSGGNPSGNWENWKQFNVRYMAYLSTAEISEAGMEERRFEQVYLSKGPLKLRVMDLGRKETRLPWTSLGTTSGSIKIDLMK